MRTTGTNADVAHVWAQDKGDPMRSGSMSTVDHDIFSYGARIGNFITTPNGTRVALLSSDHWSPTTSQHQNLASRAVSHKTGFTVPNLDETRHDYEDNVKWFISEITRILTKCTKSRGHAQWHLEHAERMIGEVEKYAAFFNIAEYTLPHELHEKARSHVIIAKKREAKLNAESYADRDKRLGPARIKRENAKKALAERKAAEIRERNKEMIEKWRNGDPHAHYPYHVYSGTGYPRSAELRLHPGDPSMVQTSQGATFPLKDAKRAFSVLVRCNREGTRFTHSGPHANLELGHFKVDSFDGTTIKAGCHIVTWDEAVRFMNSLGE